MPSLSTFANLLKQYLTHVFVKCVREKRYDKYVSDRCTTLIKELVIVEDAKIR
jgi:hypothetical protein